MHRIDSKLEEFEEGPRVRMSVTNWDIYQPLDDDQNMIRYPEDSDIESSNANRQTFSARIRCIVRNKGNSEDKAIIGNILANASSGNDDDDDGDDDDDDDEDSYNGDEVEEEEGSDALYNPGRGEHIGNLSLLFYNFFTAVERS